VTTSVISVGDEGITAPLVTVAIPSYNQGQFLSEALQSIVSQEVPVEICVMDGGSQDNSVEIIHQWVPHLAYWRSHTDQGQSAAINEGISKGRAPYVCWINSDDLFLPGGLKALLAVLATLPEVPAVYGRAWNVNERTQKLKPVWVEPFNVKRLSIRNIISQPATLIRRTAWESVGGLNTHLHLAMDYDLWWRLYREVGPLHFVEREIAANRQHAATKTQTQRKRHYQEAIGVVRQHFGRVPLKWWLYQPYAVWLKSL
jgi:glycosyltransferase involved in cell wall biosynthesis